MILPSFTYDSLGHLINHWSKYARRCSWCNLSTPQRQWCYERIDLYQCWYKKIAIINLTLPDRFVSFFLIGHDLNQLWHTFLMSNPPALPLHQAVLHMCLHFCWPNYQKKFSTPTCPPQILDLRLCCAQIHENRAPVLHTQCSSFIHLHFFLKQQVSFIFLCLMIDWSQLLSLSKDMSLLCKLLCKLLSSLIIWETVSFIFTVSFTVCVSLFSNLSVSG